MSLTISPLYAIMAVSSTKNKTMTKGKEEKWTKNHPVLHLPKQRMRS